MYLVFFLFILLYFWLNDLHVQARADRRNREYTAQGGWLPKPSNMLHMQFTKEAMENFRTLAKPEYVGYLQRSKDALYKWVRCYVDGREIAAGYQPYIGRPCGYNKFTFGDPMAPFEYVYGEKARHYAETNEYLP